MAKIYDFDRPIDRRNTASVKWDLADKLFRAEGLLPMWVADMDFPAPESVRAALERLAAHGVFGYTYRSDRYLSAVQKWMKERHGWLVEKDWLCHSPGVVTALNLIVDGFTKPGDKVLIQPPVYPPFRKSARNQGRELVTNPLICEDATYRMDFEDLEEKMSDPAVKLMILCSPHNPVGRVWTREELKHVAETAANHDVLVVSDEIHSDLVFPGHTHVPFAQLSEEASVRSIICTAPSKTFNLAGLQISNIIIPDPQLRKIYKDQLNRFSLGEPNAAGVAAAEAAYRDGADWLGQCLTYIKENGDFVRDFLNRYLPKLTMAPLEGTYLGWIDCRKLGLDDVRLQHLLLKKAKVAFNQGSTFGAEGSGFIRINLACRRELVKEAMRRLKAAISGES